MMQKQPLGTMDQLVLLALHDEKGSLRTRETVRYALAGAAMMDLARLGRIGPEGKYMVPLPGVKVGLTGDSILDDVFTVISESKRRKNTKGWVRALPGKVKKMEQRVIDRLVERGILSEMEAKVLWVFTVARYPEKDPGPERKLRERLRRIVLQGSRSTHQEIELLGLVEACKLTDELFDRGERKEARKRLKNIVRESKFGRAVSDVQKEVAAAVAATVVITST